MKKKPVVTKTKSKAAKPTPAMKPSASTPRKPIRKPAKKSTIKPALTSGRALPDDALARLQEAVKLSPSYKSAADNDPAFLAHPLTRGVRLQLDYYKPEVIMREHRIGGGIVVFGSARTPSPEQAHERLRHAKTALNPPVSGSGKSHKGEKVQTKAALKAALVRAEADVRMSRYYEMAREFARLVSRDGARRKGARLVIITGGGPGIMEAANRGAHDVNAPSVGFNISLPHEQWPNPYITPELCFNFHYFAIRKLHFVTRARALVAFPGGFGTLDELFEILTLVQTRKTRQRPVILIGKSFWDRVFKLDAMIEEGMIDASDRELFRFAESAREAWDIILEWYAQRGQPLIDAQDAVPVVG